MTIKELVKGTYIEHPSPRLFEINQLASKYKVVALEQGASFLQTYRASFFPKLIADTKRTERCIVWDNHFWDLFERFFFTISKIEKDELSSHVAYDFFISMYTIFLATRFYRRPLLSLVLAKRYASTVFLFHLII